MESKGSQLPKDTSLSSQYVNLEKVAFAITSVMVGIKVVSIGVFLTHFVHFHPMEYVRAFYCFLFVTS